MAQNYPGIAGTDYVSASREKIVDRDDALKSNFSGTTFPSTGLTVGMSCYRTDLQKLYILESISPNIWKEVTFAAALGTAASANVGTAGDALGKLNTANTWSAIQTFSAALQIAGQLITGTSGSIQLDSDIRLNANAAKNINFMIASASRMTLNADGGFVVGAASGGSKGVGSINAQTLYQNGAQIQSSAFYNNTDLTNFINSVIDTAKVSIRLIPQNSQPDNYTLVLADTGKHILHPASDISARVYTIPSNAVVPFEVGAAITFANRSTGVVTIAIVDDALILAGVGTLGSRTLGANGIATAIKVGATEWLISGTGLS